MWQMLPVSALCHSSFLPGIVITMIVFRVYVPRSMRPNLWPEIAAALQGDAKRTDTCLAKCYMSVILAMLRRLAEASLFCAKKPGKSAIISPTLPPFVCA